jgi:drug/metabolite transporter (DMT)-like permease
MMLGIVLALLSSLSFSTNSVMSRRGVAVASASAGAFITVLMGVPMFLVAALATGQLFNAGQVELNGYVLLSLAGILHFGLGRYFNYRCIGAIGATRASSAQSLATPYSIFIAFLFLGETVNLLMGVGIGLVLAGPTIMVERKKAPAREVGQERVSGNATQESFQLRQLDGYLSAMATVLAYGTSPILIRAALEDTTDLSIYGGFVAYTAAAVALILTLVIPKRRGLVTALRPSAIRLFLGAGFFTFLAQMFRFMALAVAPVTVVNPLMRTGSVFTLVLSFTINRHLEVINRRVVAGIIISVMGVMLIVINRV